MKNQLVERMLYVTLALVFIVSGTLGILSAQAIDKFTKQQAVLQEQVKGQKEVLSAVRTLISNQGQTTNQINNSLSCIMVFFSNPDRAQNYISDFSNCTITNKGTGESQILPLPQPISRSGQQNPTTQSRSQPQPAQPSPPNPGPVAVNPPQPEQPIPPAQPETPEQSPAPQQTVLDTVLQGITQPLTNILKIL